MNWVTNGDWGMGSHKHKHLPADCNWGAWYISLHLVFYHVARPQNTATRLRLLLEVKGNRERRGALQKQLWPRSRVIQQQPFYVQSLRARRKNLVLLCAPSCHVPEKQGNFPPAVHPFTMPDWHTVRFKPEKSSRPEHDEGTAKDVHVITSLEDSRFTAIFPAITPPSAWQRSHTQESRSQAADARAAAMNRTLYTIPSSFQISLPTSPASSMPP